MFAFKASAQQGTRMFRVKILSKCAFRRKMSSRLVLGIETSCDETGAAVMDETGLILGESLHSQKEVHIKTGGIIPTVAQRLHRENIGRVVQEAMERSGVTQSQLSAVATTVKPGLALSLGIGLDFSLNFVKLHQKPFIPIHHMEAHALTVRMFQPVVFPFLVLLVSGGHSLLALARGIDDFLLLGQTLDEAPGDTMDKVARRLSLIKHPKCSMISGGQAIELLARDGDRLKFLFKPPMGAHYDCNFSFAGLRNQVVSGGVASNQYIRKTLKIVTDTTGLHLLCPPSKFCTDNGVMIAWNGVERLREGKGILSHTEEVNYEPKAPLGVNITAEVKEAAIKLPPLKLRITD
ncbi:tRNA N6-adenosine threonylcarbamoyltransferase, mitochondrial isoform 2-T2 [Salvelinus alpinus]|uniref:tRNA N6-adenosine threonylcarbamoyltransferase, mitochondrial isoform X3 n=1 Tax=Salvelinus alpinus TaxID=8036 RepID=UPI0039FDC099